MPRRTSGVTTLELPTAPDGAPAAVCYGNSAFPIGGPLPGVLYLDDLALILSIGRTRAYQLEAANEFKLFEMRPRIGNKARYSGKRVQAWLDGEDQSAPARYFASARR